MNRTIWVMGILITLIAGVFAGTGVFKLEAQLNINNTGDTAQVVTVFDFEGVDSFVYGDTINDSVVSWTSPLQVIRLNIAADGAVPDTAINYVCSVDCGTNVYGFEYDPSGEDDTTVALLIDNLVDSFNNVAGMKDTVIAHDSVSYIKVVSKFGKANLESDARWALHEIDSVQIGDSTFTTIEMVCDSMVTAINADATISPYLTAAVLDDTAFQLTSDSLGLAFTVIVGDTAQDTSLTQANVTSYSTRQDTFEDFLPLFGPQDEPYNALGVHVILQASTDTAYGIGDSDSGYLWLYSAFVDNVTLIDSAVRGALPCTLNVLQPDTGVVKANLYKKLWLVYRIADTASALDRRHVEYDIKTQYFLKE